MICRFSRRRLVVHLALLLAHYNALLVVEVLLLSHENFEPDPVLRVDRCQRSAEGCDSFLGLLNIILK